MCRSVGTEVGFSMVREARLLVGPGAPRSPSLEPRDSNVPGARCLEFFFDEAPRADGVII